MESCILCYNFISDGDSLQLEQCYSSNIAGFDIIRDLFSFYEVKKKISKKTSEIENLPLISRQF